MHSNFKTMRDFATEAKRIEDAKQDYLMHTRLMVMADTEHLKLGKRPEPFGLTENGHQQLAGKLRIPFDYYGRMATVPGLREYTVNAWARSDPERKSLVRTLDGNVRAVLSDRFKPLDNWMLLEALMPALKEGETTGMRMMAHALSDNYMYIQVLFPGTERDVSSLIVPGTHRGLKVPLAAGLTFRNSEVGRARMTIQRTVWNLVCTNGLIAESIMAQYHLGRELSGGGEDDAHGNIWSEETLRREVDLIRSRARDIIRDATRKESLDEFVAKAARAGEDEIKAPMPDFIENVTRRFHLSGGEGQLVMENILKGGDWNLTRWGLANAVTSLAHQTDNRDRQYEVESIGNDVMLLTPKDWKAMAN